MTKLVLTGTGINGTHSTFFVDNVAHMLSMAEPCEIPDDVAKDWLRDYPDVIEYKAADHKKVLEAAAKKSEAANAATARRIASDPTRRRLVGPGTKEG